MSKPQANQSDGKSVVLLASTHNNRRQLNHVGFSLGLIYVGQSLSNWLLVGEEGNLIPE